MSSAILFDKTSSVRQNTSQWRSGSPPRRRDKIGRASVRYVIATAIPTSVITAQGNSAWHYLAMDERGRELEIIAVEVAADGKRPAALLVIHAMPTHLRRD
jgi:hypothetical protein